MILSPELGREGGMSSFLSPDEGDSQAIATPAIHSKANEIREEMETLHNGDTFVHSESDDERTDYGGPTTVDKDGEMLGDGEAIPVIDAAEEAADQSESPADNNDAGFETSGDVDDLDTVECPLNAQLGFSGRCECLAGYHLNAAGGQCVLVEMQSAQDELPSEVEFLTRQLHTHHNRESRAV